MATINPQLSAHKLLKLVISVLFYYLSQATYIKQNKTRGGFELRMIHIDSPDSPMYQHNLTKFERIKRLAVISESRMQYLTQRVAHKPDVSAPSLYSFLSLYYVELGLGKFENIKYQKIYPALDTACDIMWTQCEDCRVCFPQSTPYFARKTSKTYRAYPCSECPATGGKCDQDHCTAEMPYGDRTGGLLVKGIWAREKLTLASSYQYQEDVIRKFIFICALEVYDFVAGSSPNNVITGIVGLARGRYSLLTQLGEPGNYQFSHCLQDNEGRAGYYRPMLLKFGDRVERVPSMLSTPLLEVQPYPFYYLRLNDISVNRVPMNVPQHIFAVRPDNFGGTIIDSGSTYTYLLLDAYKIVYKAISMHIKMRNRSSLRKYKGNVPGFEACWMPLYDYPEVNFPSLTFHFDEGADFYVDPTEVMIKYQYGGARQPGLYCLTIFSRREGLNVLGVYQQINQYIIYDVGNSRLNFIKDDCSSRF